MKYLFILAVAFFMLLSSCSKTEEEDMSIKIPENGDYIVFGNTYGACTGDCRTLFLLTKENLYEDSNNSALEEVTFNSEPLSDDKRQIADTLFVLPQSLMTNSFSEEALIRNIPDFDYYIRGNVDAVEFMLRFNAIDSTIDAELYQYSLLLQKVIDDVR